MSPHACRSRRSISVADGVRPYMSRPASGLIVPASRFVRGDYAVGASGTLHHARGSARKSHGGCTVPSSQAWSRVPCTLARGPYGAPGGAETTGRHHRTRDLSTSVGGGGMPSLLALPVPAVQRPHPTPPATARRDTKHKPERICAYRVAAVVPARRREPREAGTRQRPAHPPTAAPARPRQQPSVYLSPCSVAAATRLASRTYSMAKARKYPGDGERVAVGGSPYPHAGSDARDRSQQWPSRSPRATRRVRNAAVPCGRCHLARCSMI
jgi:hypothetical protein